MGVLLEGVSTTLLMYEASISIDNLGPIHFPVLVFEIINTLAFSCLATCVKANDMPLLSQLSKSEFTLITLSAP